MEGVGIDMLVGEALENGPVPVPGGLLFAYTGKADRVELQVMEDRFPGVEAFALQSGIWRGTAPVDEDGALEYRLAITVGDRRRTILDPTNQTTARNPFGTNSVATGPEYVQPGWLGVEAPGPGSIQPLVIESEAWGVERHHLMYLPPDFEAGVTYPLLVWHDGPEYVEYADLSHCLDVMITKGQIPPVIALLHQPVKRNQEYADSDRHLTHVFEELLPVVRATYQIGPVVAGGASLGGIASLSLAFRRPGEIDSLVLQSASIVSALGGRFKRGPVFRQVIPLVDAVLESPGVLPGRVVMSCGTYDGLVEDHREKVPILSQGLPGLIYSEINAGHHWRCWRDRLGPDLAAALGPDVVSPA